MTYRWISQAALLIFLMELAWPFHAQAQLSGRGEIIASEPGDILPSDAITSEWINRYFETEEFWTFPDREHLEAFSQSLPPDLRKEFLSHRVEEPSLFLRINSAVRYWVHWPEYVNLPESFYRRLPAEVIDSYYRYLVDNGGKFPLFTPTDQSIQRFISGLKIDRRAKEILQKHIVNGKSLIINPVTWNYLPPSERTEYVHALLARQRVTHLSLRITQADDLEQVARRFAGENDPKPIERLLRKRLGKKKEVTFPLVDVLPKFIRKTLGTFSKCHGPNCYSTTLGISKKGNFELQFASANELVDHLAGHYRAVQPNEPLQALDQIVLINSQNETIHSFTYLGEEKGRYVFTKNGISRESPFITQTLEDLEHVYQKSSPSWVVFRQAKEGQRIKDLHSDGLLDLPVYRESNGTCIGRNFFLIR